MEVKRQIKYVVIFLAALIITWLLINPTPSKFENYIDIMNSGLSFASIGSAILILGLSFFPFSKNKGLVSKVYNKILELVIYGTVFYFVESGLSLLGLFFSENSDNLMSKMFMTTWLSLGIVCLIITFDIIAMILKEIKSSIN